MRPVAASARRARANAPLWQTIITSPMYPNAIATRPMSLVISMPVTQTKAYPLAWAIQSSKAFTAPPMRNPQTARRL